jgi:beta-mannanase
MKVYFYLFILSALLNCSSPVDQNLGEIVDDSQTLVSGPIAQPSSSTTYTMKYDFESDVQGFVANGQSGGPWRVTEWKASGNSSLKANVSLSSGKQISLERTSNDSFSGFQFLEVTVRTATWGNQGNGMSAKLFVKTGNSWQWFDSGSVSVGSSTTGTILTLQLNAVANLGSIKAIGVQFTAGSGASGSSAVYIDRVRLGQISTPPPISITPVTPGANATSQAILNKLAGMPSKTINRTISGQFLGYSGFAFTTSWLNTIYSQTNQYPGIVGMDIANGGDSSRGFYDVFDHSNNASLVSHWNNGGLIAISHHFPNPLRTNGMAGIQQTGWETTANINNMLYGPNTNNLDKERWFGGLWQVYLSLLDLKNRGITVLYRPLHEMNGDWFWYGALGTASRPGSSVADFHKLWNSIFDYMTTSKGAGYPALDNIIWVYSPDYSRDNVTAYYQSGNSGIQTDIVALDAYLDDPQTNSTLQSKYNQLLGLGKPFAFAEIGPRNTRTDGQFDYNNWLNAIRNRFGQSTFFMAWDDFSSVKIAPTSNLNASSLYNSYNWMLNRGEEPLR